MIDKEHVFPIVRYIEPKDRQVKSAIEPEAMIASRWKLIIHNSASLANCKLLDIRIKRYKADLTGWRG